MAIGKTKIEPGRPGGGAEADPSDLRRFLDLNAEFPLRPIRTDEELDGAHAVVASLIRRDDLTPAEEDYLDVLGDLARAYEDEAHPLPPVSGVDMLRHILEARDLTRAEVSRSTGIAEPTLSAILSGKRSLNLRHVQALARVFEVGPEVFLATTAARADRPSVPAPDPGVSAPREAGHASSMPARGNEQMSGTLGGFGAEVAGYPGIRAPHQETSAMSKPGDRTVYKHGDGWADKRNDAEHPAKVHDTQEEAIEAARLHSHNAGGGEVTVQGEDGKFRSKDTIAPGNDPASIKDTEH